MLTLCRAGKDVEKARQEKFSWGATVDTIADMYNGVSGAGEHYKYRHLMIYSFYIGP